MRALMVELRWSLWPSGARVRSFNIQKSSRSSRISLISSLDRVCSLRICSINMNRASCSKLCPGRRKCLSNWLAFVLSTSERWPLNLLCAGGSDLPTYWLRGHFRQYPRYIMFLLRQFRLCLISNCSPVWSLVKVFDEVSWRQHLFLVELRQGEHPTILGVFFGRTFLPLDKWTCPIKFLRFLFHR